MLTSRFLSLPRRVGGHRGGAKSLGGRRHVFSIFLILPSVIIPSSHLGRRERREGEVLDGFPMSKNCAPGPQPLWFCVGALRSEQVGFYAREGRRASVRRQLVGVAGGEDLISRRTLESKKEMRCGLYGSPRALAVQTKPLGLDLMPASGGDLAS